MDTEGPDSENGEQEPASDNVVPFPRDWFGSRDELVPFGAGGENGESQDRGPGALDSAGSPGRPPSAADFWSEDATALHDVVSSSDATTEAHTTSAAPAGPQSPTLVTSPGAPATAARIAAAAGLAIVLAVLVISQTTAPSPAPGLGGSSAGSGGPGFGAVLNVFPGVFDPLRGLVAASGGRKRRAGRKRTARSMLTPLPTSTRTVVPRVAVGATDALASATTDAAYTPGHQTSAPALIAATPTRTVAQVSSGPRPVAQPSTTPAPAQPGAIANESASRRATSAGNPPPFGADGALGPGSSPNG